MARRLHACISVTDLKQLWLIGCTFETRLKPARRSFPRQLYTPRLVLAMDFDTSTMPPTSIETSKFSETARSELSTLFENVRPCSFDRAHVNILLKHQPGTWQEESRATKRPRWSCRSPRQIFNATRIRRRSHLLSRK